MLVGQVADGMDDVVVERAIADQLEVVLDFDQRARVARKDHDVERPEDSVDGTRCRPSSRKSERVSNLRIVPGASP
jgi:hypothetical protein